MTRLVLAAVGSALALMAVEFGIPATPEVQDMAPVQAFVSDKSVNAILHRACANCHSNETKMPWYGRSGPVGWLMRRDVQKARERLNFSEQLSLEANEREEIYDAMSDRSMPPTAYRMLHPEAKLSALDVAMVERWASK